jgi:hypothetical protein
MESPSGEHENLLIRKEKEMNKLFSFASIGALVAGLTLVSCASGPKAHDFSTGPLVDELADYSLMTAYSEAELRVDGANAAVFAGDASRVCRTADTEAFLLYDLRGASKVTVEAWYWANEDIVDFEILVGKDRYSLAPFTPERKLTPASGLTWGNVLYTCAGFPAGSSVLKIVFKHRSAQNYWNPQLGKVTFE